MFVDSNHTVHMTFLWSLEKKSVKFKKFQILQTFRYNYEKFLITKLYFHMIP